MFNSTRIRRASGLALAGTMAMVLGSSAAQAQSQGHAAPAAIKEMSKLFESQCSSCHLPPDPALPTDRAWLNQIKDTA